MIICDATSVIPFGVLSQFNVKLFVGGESYTLESTMQQSTAIHMAAKWATYAKQLNLPFQTTESGQTFLEVKK